MASPREPSIFAQQLSHKLKSEHLASLTEDDFRDRVVRPILLRMGYSFYTDLCGPQEAGKDCLCVEPDPSGAMRVVAVQTKRGRLTSGANPSENVVTALTQLTTALEYDVSLPDHKGTTRPLYVILATSGAVSEQARVYLNSKLKDPRFRVWDSNFLIQSLDTNFPEFWMGIDENRFPYLRSLQKHIAALSDDFGLEAICPNSSPCTTESAYVSLNVYKLTTKIVKIYGEVSQEPSLVEIPFEKLIDERFPCLVIGEGGSGKSTALRHLCYRLASKMVGASTSHPTPVLLSAREVAESDARLVECAKLAASRIHGEAVSPFSDQDLSEGRAAFLIDALDEVPAEDRRLVLDRVSDAHKDFPRSRFIITTRDRRDITPHASSLRFTIYRMQDLSAKHAKKIVKRISEGRSISPDLANETLRRLEDVYGLTLNPLLITIFVATSDFAKQDIPPNITEIFKKYTEMMLGRWDENKGLRQQYQAPLKDLLLRHLALLMHKNESTTIPESECRALFDRELRNRDHEADLNVLFDEIVYRSGLLITEDGDVSFRHLLIQEFFAGRGIADEEELRQFIGDPWWRSAIVFYFGEHSESYSTLAKLIESTKFAKGVDLYEAAVTIGLAIQSCHLSEATARAAGLKWVVKALASALDACIEEIGSSTERPLVAFLHYFLRARDSVGGRLALRVAPEIMQPIENDLATTPSQREREQFWTLIGLLEGGEIIAAKEYISGFAPTDARLLLGLSLSCYLIYGLRESSPTKKQAAKEIAKDLGPRVAQLHAEVLREMKSMLLEYRQGEITAIQGASPNCDDESHPESEVIDLE